ncbi:hypothetical protein [Streptomyces antimycoticus]
MKRPLFRRCGHAPGALSPEDQAAVDAFRAMLAARANPQSWTPGSNQDIALQVGPFIERARPRHGDDHGPDVIAVALVHPDDPHVRYGDRYTRKGWLRCETSTILGTWTPAYRMLTRAAASLDLPTDVGMPPAHYAVHIAQCPKGELGQLLLRIGPYTQCHHAERDADRLNAQLQNAEAVAKTVPFDVSDHASYRDPYEEDIDALLAATVGGEEGTAPQEEATATLTNTSLRCPQCQGTELTAGIVRYRGGGADIANLSCVVCGCTWEVWETPDVPGPHYAAAYADAPTLAEEEAELEALAKDLNARSATALTGTGPSVPSIDHRLFLLRKAAWLDRAARELEMGQYLGGIPAARVEDGRMQATQAARTLLAWDLEHDQDDVAGPIGPDSSAWTTAAGARAYVRQEYRALLDQEQEAEDRAHMEPRRGPDGELYDTTGNPL